MPCTAGGKHVTDNSYPLYLYIQNFSICAFSVSVFVWILQQKDGANDPGLPHLDPLLPSLLGATPAQSVTGLPWPAGLWVGEVTNCFHTLLTIPTLSTVSATSEVLFKDQRPHEDHILAYNWKMSSFWNRQFTFVWKIIKLVNGWLNGTGNGRFNYVIYIKNISSDSGLSMKPLGDFFL